MDLSQYPLWTALVTPFTHDGAVDFPSLLNLLKEQESAGNGVLLLGSTGEGLNVSPEQRKEVVKFAVSKKLDIPLMVGVGGHRLPDQLQWVSWLESMPIHAYLMVTPIYAKAGAEGQYHWFKTLLDAVERPVMLYNVPGRAASSLSIEAVERLRDHDNFWSIKEASGDVEKCKKYIQAADGHLVFCGDDALLPQFAQAGCKGLVSVASNVWPAATHRYVRQCLDGRLQEGDLWRNASEALFSASNPVPAKYLLHSEGRIDNTRVLPPLHADDMRREDTLNQLHKQILAWEKNQTQS
jgi:4-hydroxy-tetrahydrodipicolinate synthase